MLAVKGHYKDGKITLLESLPENIHEAELIVVVLPMETSVQRHFPTQEYVCREATSEEEFMNLGLSVFLTITMTEMWTGRIVLGLSSRVGEIVLFDFPYTNARGSKVRPAIIVHDHGEHGSTSDITVAYMTTEVDSYAFSPHAVLIEQQDLAFGTLKVTSVVRTDKLITIAPSICRRIQGNLVRLVGLRGFML